MTILQIPVRNDIQQYQFRIDLDTSTYSLRFHYNNRDARWTMHILDSDNVHLLSTVLVANWSLTGRFVKDELPPGRFLLLDKEGRGGECGLLDLGNRHILLYETAT